MAAAQARNTVPLVEADGTGGHTPYVRLDAGSGPGANVGASTVANGQVTASTTAGALVGARPTRRSLVVVNTSGSIIVYIGIATVTAGNGLPLQPGDSISIDTTAALQVIAASGTPVVAYMETYD